MKEANFKVVQLSIGDAAHTRVVIVVVENIIVEFRADKNTREHQSTAQTCLPVDVVRRDAEARMLNRETVDVNEGNDEASF